MKAIPPPSYEIVRLALDEDLGRGDLTTDACVPGDQLGNAELAAREPLVACGLSCVIEVFAQVDAGVQVNPLAADGDRLVAGQTLAQITGSAGSILKGERVALNFCQRLSGIATLTRKFVDACGASRLRIVDTRKTTPGLRRLERYAVRCGGGFNHREDLGSAVLIKDNHIAAAGSVASAIARAREHAPHTTKIECEVDSLAQLDEALAAGVDIVLLDNFSDDQIRAAVRQINGACFVEVSGGITLERIPSIASIHGVDAVSVGALTHSARAVDLGLDWT